MKPNQKKSIIISFIIMVITGLAGLSAGKTSSAHFISNEFIEKIISQLKSAWETHPEDRVYVHCDKPFYKPGESIWFKTYVRNGQDFKPSAKSDIVHVELINPKGSVERRIKLIANKGNANGDFFLDENAPGGLYKIKAYTNWQKNDGEDAFFEKEIQVQAVVLPKLKMKLDFERKAFGKGDDVTATVNLNTLENKALANYPYRFTVKLDGNAFLEEKGTTADDGSAYIKFKLPDNLKTNDGLLNILISHEGNTESISRSIPIILNKIEFTAYPEGGDLVAGLESKVGFKALNEFGKPADVEGMIINSLGKPITTFKSYHQGMGVFTIRPVKGEKYKAIITKPKNIEQTFDIPEAYERGYILSVENTKSDMINLNISSTEFEEMSVIAQVRGKIFYTGKIQANYGVNKLFIPATKFPIGVAQITLFDSKGIERAERLVFVNKDKQLKVKIETDKEKYLPREKVKMSIRVTDERGMAMPANLSLAVVDDKLLSFADDKSANILSKLLLEYDIKEKVEEPAFYFNPEEVKADTALDFLLMTSGWRRFTWKQITDNEIPAISHQGEKAVVSGIVTDAYTGKAISKAEVRINNKNLSVETNEQGKFTFNYVDLSEPVMLTINAQNYRAQNLNVYEYNSNLQLYLYNNNNMQYPQSNTGVKKYKSVPAYRDGNDKIMAPKRAGIDEIPMAQFEFNDAPAPAEMAVGKKEEMKVELQLQKNPIAEALAEEANIIDLRMNNEGLVKMEKKPIAPVSQYYRTREFPVPAYDKDQNVEVRTDFRSTIYWNGNIETDRTGKAVIEFYNSDEITSFRATAEGISADGIPGHAEKTYFTQLPFSMSVKAPVEVTTGDVVSLSLSLKNNTGKPISGTLKINSLEGLQLVKNITESQTIAANETKVIYLDYKVLDKPGKDKMEISFKSLGLNDAFAQEIKISPRGFPASISFSGKEIEKEYTVNISNMVAGSMKASFTAYPSVVSDLMKGIESIIREPYGCFEQTSTSNYPNIMVKQYLLEQQGEGQSGQQGTPRKKAPLPADLEARLDKGYKRLITFETKEKGFEWFGGIPAHEALTAYGLMQFNDMKKVYDDVDDAMMNRTANWLMSRKDGKGGFQKSAKALDQFGRASDEITNAYIVYALSEAGYKDIQKEADKAFEAAMASKDPYQLSLAANTMLNIKDKGRATKALDLLVNSQKSNGSWAGLTHSVTYSQGNSLQVETSSLAILALLKSGAPDQKALNKGIEFIVSSRSGYGGFGSTQGTILALKALTEYARYSKRTDENGTIEVFVDGQKVFTKEYKAGTNNAITEENMAKFLSPGKHKIKVKYVGVKNPLPYSLAINYSTFLPNSSENCKISLKTELKAKAVNVGETVRLAAVVKNKTNEGLPMTMAIIGIPAGMSAQPWQLKELQEKKVVDFYEVRDNNIFFYYRQMTPSEVREINLDLKAEISGEYEAPASVAYLYYTNEYKCWSQPEKISIKK